VRAFVVEEARKDNRALLLPNPCQRATILAPRTPEQRARGEISFVRRTDIATGLANRGHTETTGNGN